MLEGGPQRPVQEDLFGTGQRARTLLDTQFVTIAHELGHLSLGHLGPDSHLAISQRRPLEHSNVSWRQRASPTWSVSEIVSNRDLRPTLLTS
jgi:hypothetical protein